MLIIYLIYYVSPTSGSSVKHTLQGFFSYPSYVKEYQHNYRKQLYVT